MEKKKEVSRRDFLKTAAVAAAGAAVAGTPRPGYVAESGVLKIGLIGCGGRGTGAAGQALRAAELCGVPAQLVAVADVLDRARGVAKRFMESPNKAVRAGAKIADDMVFDGVDAYKKLLAVPDIGYIILAAHPGFRPSHFEAAVEAKKQIFTEKPVATDPVGMRRFMAAAKKSEELKLSVVAGTQRRHQANYVTTVGKIHEGAIGDVLAVRVYWCGGGVYNQHQPKPAGMSDLEWQIRDWYAHCWICGDNIVEQHVHNLDVANWVMKAHPAQAFGSGGRAWKRKDDFLGNIWDNFSVDYEYPNGVHMLSMCRHWERGSGSVSEAFVGTKGKSSGSDMGTGDLQWEEPYTQEHIDLINSITGKGKFWNEAMQVAETTFTGILGRESAYQGKTLKWDELLSSELSYFPKELSFDAKIPLAPVPHPGVPDWYKLHEDCL
jgi:predicted dehydrogenase